MPVLSVVVPVYNEEEVIPATHARLLAVLEAMAVSFEIVYVNDGSRDGTLAIMVPWAKQDSRVRLVNFARNFGHQAAVSCGLAHARGQAVVIIDADLQDPPELIPKMFSLWKEGWDVVYGKRLERKGESGFKRFTARMFYQFMDYLTDGMNPRDTGDFRLIDRKVCDVICNSMQEHNRFLRGMVAWVGFRQMPLEYVREPRFAGVTKYPFKKMLALAKDGIFSFSVKPLKMILTTGILTMAGSFLWLVLALIFDCLYDQWTGWLTVACTGVILTALGLVCEYLSRMFEEAKNRPGYIVRTGPDEYFNGEPPRGIED